MLARRQSAEPAGQGDTAAVLGKRDGAQLLARRAPHRRVHSAGACVRGRAVVKGAGGIGIGTGIAAASVAAGEEQNAGKD